MTGVIQGCVSMRFKLGLFAGFCLFVAGACAQEQQPAPAPQIVNAPASTSTQTTAPNPLNARLDVARLAIEQVEAGLLRKDLSDNDLANFRGQLDAPQLQILGVIEELTPKLAAAKSRLDQLGPKPTDKDPVETSGVAQDRADQEKLFNQIDEMVRKGRLLSVQADQIKGQIGVRRHALFTHALFQRNSSMLSPSLWWRVMLELPQDWKQFNTVMGDWYSVSFAKLPTTSLALLIGLVLLGGLIYRPLMRVASNVVERDKTHEQPSRLRKVLAALWLALITAAVPIGMFAAMALAFDAFELLIPKLQPVTRAAFDAVVRISLTYAMSRALLAPRRPTWRLVDLSDATATRVSRLALSVAIIVSTAKIVEAINDVIAASLLTSVFTRGIGSLAVVAAMSVSLRQILPPAESKGGGLPPEQDTYAWLRLFAWTVVIAVTLSVIVGYVAFSAFLIDQMVWVSFIGTLLYLLLMLAEDGITELSHTANSYGRSIIAGIGMRPESVDQIAILLSGLLRVILVAVAIMVILAPWGIESDDMVGSVKTAFFGFKVGDVNISLSTIIISVLLFIGGFIATRALQKWLDAKFLPATNLDTGLRNSIRTSLGYVGITLAIALALSHVGLSFERFALVAGGLSLGIGLGLQSIVNNFVSGLILLWERAVRVGDWVVVGTEEGFVRRINVRSTEIETFDRATVILPNTNLVGGVVKNWVHSDRVGRILIEVRAPYECDPELFRSILIKCAKDTDLVLGIPAPLVIFKNFGESALHFELICFVDEVETAGMVKSDLHYLIFSRLREAGITMPMVQREITLRGVETIGLAAKNHDA